MNKICIVNKTKESVKLSKIKKVGNEKNSKRKFIVVMSFLVLLVFVANSKIFASDISQNYGKYRIFAYEESNRYIKYRNVPQRIPEYYYLNKNSVKLPAYCMNLGMIGAEKISGGYEVAANEAINDNIVNNIILNGYPYKTIEQLGLQTESQARYATQFAIWAKLNNLDLNSIVPMEPQYQNVIDAIKNIYVSGTNLNLSYTNGININEVKQENIIDKKDNKYYSKEYILEYGENILDIKINITGVKDYIITDENNNKLDKIVGNKKIKILFPRDSNVNSSTCNLNFNTTYKQTAVLFGVAGTSDLQNVSLTLEPVTTSSNALNFKYNKVSTKLVILKKDADDSSINISNVKFQILDKDDKVIGEYITDKNGKINLELEKDLKIFENTKLKIKEVEVPYPYVISKDSQVKEVNLKVGDNKEVEFKNNKEEIPQEKVEIHKENIEKVELPKTGF